MDKQRSAALKRLSQYPEFSALDNFFEDAETWVINQMTSGSDISPSLLVERLKVIRELRLSIGVSAQLTQKNAKRKRREEG